MVWRQPFPGPGLAIRVIGEVTPEKLEILRSADFIFMSEIKKAKLTSIVAKFYSAHRCTLG